MPLTWAHAEYLKLCASIEHKKVVDMPNRTRERYVNKKTTGKYQGWRFDNRSKNLPQEQTLRIEVMADAKAHWTDDDWKTERSLETHDTGIGIYIADIEPKNRKAEKLEFPFYWKETDQWEGKNCSVRIA